MGRSIIQKRTTLINLEGGFLASHEVSTDTATVTNSIEGLIQLNYRKFKIIDPEININATFRMFPSISKPGRLRSRVDLVAKIELIKDLFFSITFWDDFDNKPRSETAAKNDWGVVTSLGYSF